MNPTMPPAVADFFAGSKAADPDIWASPFATDVEVQDPVGQPSLTGRAAVRERMATFLPYFTEFTGLTPTDAYQSGDSTAVHWTATAITATGRRLAWAGITVFTLNDAGHIQHMRAYFDSSIFS
jgi:steroid Delta-isomerase